MPPALETLSLNQWTTKEVQKKEKKKFLHFEVDPNKIHTHNCLISLYISSCLFFLAIYLLMISILL